MVFWMNRSTRSYLPCSLALRKGDCQETSSQTNEEFSLYFLTEGRQDTSTSAMAWSSMTTALLLVCVCLLYMTPLVYSAPRRVVEMKEEALEKQKLSNDKENLVQDVKYESGKDKKQITAKAENVLKGPVEKSAKLQDDDKGVDPEHLEKIADAQKARGKSLSLDDLQPVDHLDAVKLEQDGMINKDYKKEVFLGNHEEIDDDNGEVAEVKVRDIFKRVDANGDGKMCTDELKDWIINKTKEHFLEAAKENEHIFEHMDPDGDGFVTWKEYYIHFLLAKGYDMEQASKQVVDYDVIDMDYAVKEQLIRYKFKWTDADIEEVDNKLSQREFFAFRHPEQSPLTLNKMITAIIENLDKDNDGNLTEEEFVVMNTVDVNDEEVMKLEKDWQEERREEFRKHIDKDGDGKITMNEMRDYMDPRNPDQAANDVRAILDQVDDSEDDCINWEEILNNREVFIHSKVINVRKILHDEF